MADQDYEWWHNALRFGVGVPGKTDVHDGDPQCGRYIYKSRGERLPVAIWKEGDEFRCLVGSRGAMSHEDATMLWTYVAKNPIPESAYSYAFETGTWADDPMPGSNEPADDFEMLQDQIGAALDLAKTMNVADQLSCDQAANLRDRLNRLWDHGEELRKAEKRPFDEGAKQVQAKYAPVLDRAKQGVALLRALITPFLRDQEAKALQEAATAAKAGEAPAVVQVKAGGASGRRTGLRTVTIAEIVDYEAALIAVKNDSGVKDAVQKACDRRAKAGVETQGVNIRKEKVAA